MKTALITGASRGIGRAVARELAHQGWAVGINYLNRADKARELVEELTAAGCHAAMFRGRCRGQRCCDRDGPEAGRDLQPGRIGGKQRRCVGSGACFRTPPTRCGTGIWR
ncbi:MAG: SDR family NAD(P)-dependent oxidoreductase [Dysosmobacter sp.]